MKNTIIEKQAGRPSSGDSFPWGGGVVHNGYKITGFCELKVGFIS